MLQQCTGSHLHLLGMMLPTIFVRLQAQLSEARSALSAAQEAAAAAEEKLEVTVASLTEQHEAANAALQASYARVWAVFIPEAAQHGSRSLNSGPSHTRVLSWVPACA
jgi:hypothetical protein